MLGLAIVQVINFDNVIAYTMKPDHKVRKNHGYR